MAVDKVRSFGQINHDVMIIDWSLDPAYHFFCASRRTQHSLEGWSGLGVTIFPSYTYKQVVFVTGYCTLSLTFLRFMHLLIWMTYIVILTLLTNSVMLMYWIEDPTQISVFVSTYLVVVQSNLLAWFEK